MDDNFDKLISSKHLRLDSRWNKAPTQDNTVLPGWTRPSKRNKFMMCYDDNLDKRYAAVDRLKAKLKTRALKSAETSLTTKQPNGALTAP